MAVSILVGERRTWPLILAMADVQAISTTIFVRGLSVSANIGLYAHEQGLTQPLVIDADLHIETDGWSRLSDTVNYERVGLHARAIADAVTSVWSRPSPTASPSPASPNPG